jgi:hypothetical protein
MDRYNLLLCRNKAIPWLTQSDDNCCNNARRNDSSALAFRPFLILEVPLQVKFLPRNLPCWPRLKISVGAWSPELEPRSREVWGVGVGNGAPRSVQSKMPLPAIMANFCTGSMNSVWFFILHLRQLIPMYPRHRPPAAHVVGCQLRRQQQSPGAPQPPQQQEVPDSPRVQ